VSRAVAAALAVATSPAPTQLVVIPVAASVAQALAPIPVTVGGSIPGYLVVSDTGLQLLVYDTPGSAGAVTFPLSGDTVVPSDGGNGSLVVSDLAGSVSSSDGL